MSRPARWECERCRRLLAEIEFGSRVRVARAVEIAYVAEQGVAIVCPGCATPGLHSWPIEEDEPIDPAAENLLRMMEERWQSFRITKLRERGSIAVGLRFDVFNRDGFRCRYCGVSVNDGAVLHADHVIPESKGGPTTLENLVTACMDCNLGKSDKDLLL